MRRARTRPAVAVRERLEARRGEIETAALTRVRAISDPREIADPAYAEGLRAAVSAAIGYGIETTGHEAGDPPVPVALLAQARMAARVGIPLETVQRRYFAGYSLLGYFILEEAAHAGIADGVELKRLLGAHAGLFDRLLAAIAAEHAREAELHRRSIRDEQAECVERLLAGGMAGSARLGYELARWHLGVVARGASAEGRIREAAAGLDCCALCVRRPEGAVWGWLGARRRLDPAGLAPRLAPEPADEEWAVALGEPAEGLAGWRLTHRQAAAALAIAERSADRTARYRDVALLVCADRDEVLSASLRHLYLEPLARGPGGGALLRETLRAYFAAQGNMTSAAAALGVSRQTIHNRLRAVEETLGRTVDSCAADLTVALGLAELDASQAPGVPASHID